MCCGVHRHRIAHDPEHGRLRFPTCNSKWQEIRLGAFTILVNLCLLMQGTKLLTFSMLDWGCQIFHGTWECQKELFIKSSDTIQSTRRLNHFLVEVKILHNGWHPWMALLQSVPWRRFLMLHVNFRRIDFVHRKKSLSFNLSTRIRLSN